MTFEPQHQSLRSEPMHGQCDVDELLVALGEIRVARDRILRQLPECCAQDTVAQTALARDMNEAFAQLSLTALTMRKALDRYLTDQVDTLVLQDVVQ